MKTSIATFQTTFWLLFIPTSGHTALLYEATVKGAHPSFGWEQFPESLVLVDDLERDLSLDRRTLRVGLALVVT